MRLMNKALIFIVALFFLGCATQSGTLKQSTISDAKPIMKMAPVIEICNQGHQHVNLLKSDYDAIMRYVKWLEER